MRRESPVVVVLPFAVTAGDDSDLLLARGLVEDIAGELTRFRTLQVVSPVSGAAVASLTDRDVGERLGATHVLRGTLRRSRGCLRVSASLVECAGGTQIWSETIEAAEADFFTIGDGVVGSIVATLAIRLERSALAESGRKPPGKLAAYELTLRGLTELRKGTEAADEAARAIFERAIEIAPTYARAHAGLALSWFNEFSCRFWDRAHENGQLAYAHAHRALELDDRDALLHLVIGKVLLFRREFDGASWYLDRALALCPNDADLLIQLSLCDVYLGRCGAATEHADKAMRLNPYHPNTYYSYAAVAHAAARNFETVLRLARAIDEIPILDVPAYVAVALAHLGRVEEGREWLARYAAMYQESITHGRPPDAGEACRWLLEVNPYRRDEDRQLVAEGFRRLGETDAPRTGFTAVPEPAPADAVFARQGESWFVAFGGRQTILADLKGLHDIQRLLASPGDEIHCLDLADRGGEVYGADSVLDDKARGAIRVRIRDLQEELAEAEGMNDSGRAARARAELDALTESLASALGLGGRSRRLGDTAERARTAVTWRIRHAVKKLEAVHPELGRHLLNSLRTGTFCAYRPERQVRWRLDDRSPNVL